MSKYSSYILYLLIATLVVILYVNDFGPLTGLQRSINDFICSLTAPDTQGNDVVLVEIDARSQNEYGEWPWNRDRIADLAAATGAGEPRVLVLDFDLSEDSHQDSAGYTEILAGQLGWIKNVVLPYDIALANYRSNITSNPDFLFNNSVGVDDPLGVMGDGSSLLTRKVFLPASKLLETSAFLGYDYEQPDDDHVLRRHPLITYYEGYYYPSIALLAAGLYLGVEPPKITVTEGQSVAVGGAQEIPITADGQMLLMVSDQGGFRTFSAAEVLSDSFDRSRLAGKVVIITPTGPKYVETYNTAVRDGVPEPVIKATAIANIINGSFIIDRTHASLIDILLLVMVGGLCAFLLPRVALTHRMAILGAGLVLLANVNYFLLSSFHILGNTVFLGLEVILFMIASPLLDSELLGAQSERAVPKARRSEPPVEKTPVTREQVAAAPVREIASSESDEENLKTRALTASDRVPTDDSSRLSTRATDTRDSASFGDHQAISLDDEFDADAETPDERESGVDDHDTFGETPAGLRHDDIEIDDQDDDESIVDSQRQRTDRPPEIVNLDDSDSNMTSAEPEGVPVADSGKIDIKNLGRYQITGLLGKGAMGKVYKGIDPAINRPVALKTIRLDFVNDPEELEELKERLHREAQAAGKLSHPNIVTVYDVGSEGALQYIAMEYLEGVTLEDLIKKKTKFNYRIIAQIIMQICSALDYAHEQNIVHRDIKPANIMILPDYRVKVMDYGIARVDSNSMTKTGIAMGTPNYISPEQLKGQAIDRRADIFSLGVVMYEMLLGRRPFKGENISSLIYSIMNQEPDKPSDVNQQIPLLFDHILAKALKKNPGERYQRASEVAADLKDFVESFATR